MTVEEVVALGRLPHEPPLDRLAALGRDGRRCRDRARRRRSSAWARRTRAVARRAATGVRGRGVAQAAPILILDEPTAHLDIRHQVDVMELLVDLNERDGTTIVAVLHDLALAAHFFPRVVVMDAGPDRRRRRRRRLPSGRTPSAGCSGSILRSSICRGRRVRAGERPGGEIAAAFAMLTRSRSGVPPGTRPVRRHTASSGRWSGRSVDS